MTKTENLKATIRAELKAAFAVQLEAIKTVVIDLIASNGTSNTVTTSGRNCLKAGDLVDLIPTELQNYVGIVPDSKIKKGEPTYPIRMLFCASIKKLLNTQIPE